MIYDELVKALRHVGIHQDCNECEAGRWHNEFDCCLFKDAADAIEVLQAQLPKRGEIVRCVECKYSSKPDTNGEIWCKREGHGEDLMECHGVGWFCADGERSEA